MNNAHSTDTTSEVQEILVMLKQLMAQISTTTNLLLSIIDKIPAHSNH